MGFSLDLLLYLPHTGENPNGHYTVWKVAGVIAGEVRWPGNNSPMLQGGNLCNTAMLSWLYGKLLEIGKDRITRKSFAPAFAIPEDLSTDPRENPFGRDPHAWLWNNCTRLPNRHQVVLPMWNSERKSGYPDVEDRRTHNQKIALSRRRFVAWKRAHTPFEPLDRDPFLWMHCGTAAKALRELEYGTGHRTQELLRADKVATAMVRARRKYIGELGEIGGHVLFCFQGFVQSWTAPFM